MNTTSITSPVEKRAYSDAAAIAKARADLENAKKARREAEKQAEAAHEAESAAAGLVAVAIANAVRRGADPVLVLPAEMLNAHRNPDGLIIASPAELTIKRIANSLSITGSRFPGWMEITIGELFVHYMPTPLWLAWDRAEEARRARAKQEARA